MSLSEDRTVTLKRFYSILNDEIVNQIVSSSSQLSNQIILDLLITGTKNDYQLLGLSFLIERLATDDVLMFDCPNIHSFRNGWL